MTEAYSVSFDKTNYHAPIIGENKDAVLLAREQEIKDNLIRYIGEYRLGVKFDEFYYGIGTDQHTGEQFVTSSDQGPARDIFRKSIYERDSKGLSVRRETAECLGFEKFEKGMLEKPIGTMAVWASPPGPQEEGYGGYSFTFVAQSIYEDREKKIRMIPYRNTFCKTEHNEYLSRIAGEKIEFSKDTEFLSSPIFAEPSEDIKTPSDLLKMMGEKEEFSNEWYEKFSEASWPLLQGFLYLVKNNASDEELKKALNALENFALAYKADDTLTLADEFVWKKDGNLYDPHGHIGAYIQAWGEEQAPVVLGSCGVGGEREANLSPQRLGEFHQTYNKVGADEDKYGKREFDCPSCKKKIRRPVDTLIKKCPHMNCENPESVAC